MMGEYLFGNRMLVFDSWMISTIAFNWGAGELTGLQAFGIAIGAALLSSLLTALFASNSK